MSKTKKIEKQHYELLYIIPNNFTEEEAGQIHEKIKDQITQKGGEFTLEENWGKRKLSYPIKNFNHGYYNLIEFDSYTESLEKINQFLKLLDEVLRFQVVKKSKETKKTKPKKRGETVVASELEKPKQEEKVEEIEKEKKDEPLKDEKYSSAKEEAQEKQEEKSVSSEEEKPGEKEAEKESKKEPESSEEKKESEGKEKEEESKKEEENKEKKKDDKVDMDELDKKLDDILNTDDLL